ncbi:MAG: cytochrome c5 family protein [Gammaproteobacteria bacterium]
MTIRKVFKPTAYAVFLFSTFLIGACSSDKGEEVSEEAVKENTAPVGEVKVASESGGEAASPAASGGKGQEIYDGVCFACHAQGLAGAPMQGDKAAWADRLAQGNDKLYSNAINGYTGASGSMMPAKGGRADLSDDDVKAAVDYMIKAAGGTVAMAATAEPAAMAASSGGADGKAVYDASCALCHTTGVAGAPKYGDAEGWKARIAQGNDTLYDHALNGFMGKGMMPPRGGNAKLTDEEVKAAVDHMVAGSQ